MHLIEGNPISEQYFEEGIKHFKKEFNIDLKMFPARSPVLLSPELRFQEYKVIKISYIFNLGRFPFLFLS